MTTPTRTPDQQNTLTDVLAVHRGNVAELAEAHRAIKARGFDDIATAACLIAVIDRTMCRLTTARTLAAAIAMLVEREDKKTDACCGDHSNICGVVEYAHESCCDECPEFAKPQADVDRYFGPLIPADPPRERHVSLEEKIAAAKAEAAKFNAEYPPGTPVEYWSGARQGDGKTGHTDGEAFSSTSGQAVVFLDNASSYHALTHVHPLAEVKP